jgi:DNA-binding ferritin-like protein
MSNICNNIVSDDTLKKYNDIINSIFVEAKTAADGSEINIGTIVDALKKNLTDVNQSMATVRKIVNDCINNFKQKLNQPDTVYDKNTSYLMLDNSLLLHQEIIYNRIQLLFYIFALLYCFYRLRTAKNN